MAGKVGKSRQGAAKAAATKTGRASKAPANPKALAKPKAAKAAARPTANPAERVVDPSLFAPLTAGEVADAVRTVTEDRRLVAMAKVGRYRVITCEPLVVKPPHWMAGHRTARVVIYDYASDRTVDACVDLDAGVVAHLDINRSQPMLAREEEAIAIATAAADERVREVLGVADVARCALQYWGKSAGDLAATRRSAAVIFGRPGGHPSTVVVVDLLDHEVTEVIPAQEW